MCRLIATTLGALIGCTDATAPVDNYQPVHASQADGHRAILDAFNAKDDAYVVALGQLAAGDYYYRVTDESRANLSKDGLACRRVHISDTGAIDIVYDAVENGAACQHPCKFATQGGLTVRLTPFDDTSDQSYRVEVAQNEDFAGAIADAFFVAPR